jgi:anti-sigma factor RsiW
MFETPRNRFCLLRGEAPGCDWVRIRLTAYDLCDVRLSEREYAVIDAHLAKCAACAREYAEIQDAHEAIAEFLYPDECLTVDPEAMARSVIAESRARERFRGAAADGRPRRFRSVAALATAALLLIIAAPVLAYVGHAVWEAVTGSADKEIAFVESSSPVVRSVGSDGSDRSEAVGSPAASESDPAATAADTIEATLGAVLDRMAEEAFIKAEVEAMLPHTEEEYEAWARQEYPHIMWLYDVLASKEGTDASEASPERRRVCPFFGNGDSPPNSPAGRLVTFATDDNGNPTITLPDTEGNMVTLCAIRGETGTVPSERSETGLSPASTQIVLNVPSEPWDGMAVNVPDWAQRLYADVPESQRPTGWRALLIYSGEVFKFDHPQSLDEPNCVPTAGAIQAAAAVAALAIDAGETPDERDADFTEHVAAAQIPRDYVDALASDIPRAKLTVTYVLVSALTVGMPQFDGLSEAGRAALSELLAPDGNACQQTSIARALSCVVEARRDCLRAVTE